MAAGCCHEREAATIRCRGSGRPLVCGGGTRWPEDPQHGGVLQPPQQELERHATHVHSQTRSW